MDFDRVLARIVNGPDRPQVRRVEAANAGQARDAFAPLLKFADAWNLMQREPDVVILSLALNDFLAEVDPNGFERQIAALSDIISASHDCPVVWATPPALPAGHGDLRPYAVAIRRVAAARNIPVADVFTAFETVGRERALFSPEGSLALSQAGQNLCAQVMARSLLRP